MTTDRPDDLDSRCVVVSIYGETLGNLLAGRVEIVNLATGNPGGKAAPWPDDARIVGLWIENYRNPPTLSLKVRSAEFSPVDGGAMCPEAFPLFRFVENRTASPAFPVLLPA